MTVEQARRLIGEWPKEAEYLLTERWKIKDDDARGFWQAVEDTRKIWEWTWGKEAVNTQLRIEKENQWKTSTQSFFSAQAPLF